MPDSPYYTPGMYHSQGNQYLLIAALAVDRCGESGFQLDAHTAQIMAAVAAEAFIDELALSLSLLTFTGTAPELARVGAILHQLETSRVQVTEKYSILSQLLPGKPFESGSQPFQGFTHLIKIRNALVHPKSDTKPPGWFSYFVANELVVQMPDSQTILQNWRMQVRSKKCASWACRAAIRIIISVIDRLKEACKHYDVLGVYEQHAQLWEWAKSDLRIWTGRPSDSI